jgi:hypothetical protein
MAEFPIQFSGPMVRAILDGRKTQTRRIIGRGVERPDPAAPALPQKKRPRSWKPGDTLWVREAWRMTALLDHLPPREIAPFSHVVFYEAGGSASKVDGVWTRTERPLPYPAWIGKKRPGMFMPRWMSRISLKVTALRFERLQAISEEDAQAEGARVAYGEPFDPDSTLTDRRRFWLLWESINGPGSWDANPVVSVTTFERITDEPEAA